MSPKKTAEKPAALDPFEDLERLSDATVNAVVAGTITPPNRVRHRVLEKTIAHLRRECQATLALIESDGRLVERPRAKRDPSTGALLRDADGEVQFIVVKEPAGALRLRELEAELRAAENEYRAHLRVGPCTRLAMSDERTRRESAFQEFLATTGLATAPFSAAIQEEREAKKRTWAAERGWTVDATHTIVVLPSELTADQIDAALARSL